MGAPPLKVAVQVTDSSTVGEDGEQLMLSIAGCTTTVTVTEWVSLPAALATVSEMVRSPGTAGNQTPSVGWSGVGPRPFQS